MIGRVREVGRRFGREEIENPLFIRFDYAKRSKINEASSADPSNLYAAINRSPAFWNQEVLNFERERDSRNLQIAESGRHVLQEWCFMVLQTGDKRLLLLKPLPDTLH